MDVWENAERRDSWARMWATSEASEGRKVSLRHRKGAFQEVSQAGGGVDTGLSWEQGQVARAASAGPAQRKRPRGRHGTQMGPPGKGGDATRPRTGRHLGFLVVSLFSRPKAIGCP